MKICLVTGSGGLIGSECVEFFSEDFDLIVGIDNDMRRYFFGDEASTDWNVRRLEEIYPNYKHYNADIRDQIALEKIFTKYGEDISLICTPPHSRRTIGRQKNRTRILRSTPTARSTCLN